MFILGFLFCGSLFILFFKKYHKINILKCNPFELNPIVYFIKKNVYLLVNIDKVC